MTGDRWDNAASYERFMGRWSRPLAHEFVLWLGVRPGANWLEIGCGTGSLTAAICDTANPLHLTSCDTASEYVDYCRQNLRHPALEVVTADLESLPPARHGYDVVVSSLVLNFLPDPVASLARMRTLCAVGGSVAACVWDYAEGMEFLRHFWDAAVALEPAARLLHEGFRFPLCNPSALSGAFDAAGLESVEVSALSIPTRFVSFADYWLPIANGPGPAPTYLSTLPEDRRRMLADRLRSEMFGSDDAPIELRARAWAVRGRRGSA